MNKIKLGVRFSTVIAVLTSVIKHFNLGNFVSEVQLEWEDKNECVATLLGRTDHGYTLSADFRITLNNSDHVNAFPISEVKGELTWYRTEEWSSKITCTFICQIERDGIKVLGSK